MMLADDRWLEAGGYFPLLNMILILVVMTLIVRLLFRLSRHDQIHSELAMLQMRLRVIEQTTPCQHCREHHPCEHAASGE